MEALLSIEEVARRLDLSVSTIYKLVSAKKINYVKIGSRVLFDPEKIRAWIEEHSVAPLV